MRRRGQCRTAAVKGAGAGLAAVVVATWGLLLAANSCGQLSGRSKHQFRGLADQVLPVAAVRLALDELEAAFEVDVARGRPQQVIGKQMEQANGAIGVRFQFRTMVLPERNHAERNWTLTPIALSPGGDWLWPRYSGSEPNFVHHHALRKERCPELGSDPK